MKSLGNILIFVLILIVIVFLTVVVLGVKIAGAMMAWVVGLVLFIVIVGGILYLVGRNRRCRTE